MHGPHPHHLRHRLQVRGVRLLDRSLRRLSLYAVAVLLLSVPGYYLMVRSLWMGSVDESLADRRDALEEGLARTGLTGDTLLQAARLAERLQPGLVLTPIDGPARPDRVYTALHPDEPGGGDEQFRCLAGTVQANGTTWAVVLEEEVEETDEVVGALVTVTAAFLAVLLGGFVLLNKRLGRRVWRPFEDTLARLRAFDLSAQRPLVPAASDVAEINELNTTLVRLADRALATYREQKEFTENAAHEMQTPLALLQSRMDLLLQSPGLTEEQAELVEGAKRTVDRLAHLHQDLLLLSRIENGQWPAEAPIDLSALVVRSADALAEQAALQGIVVEQHVRPGIQLAIHATLAASLVGNLLSNALRHNRPDGRIRIDLEPGALVVANTGDTPPLDPALLFQRFRTFDARHKGHGLGLSIAKRIADLHGAQLTYAHREGWHVFTLSFRPPSESLQEARLALRP